MEADLMTIRDLAARWGVPVERAKRHVRRGGVPFLRIGEADMRINWRTTRFRPADVLRWEEESACAFEPRDDRGRETPRAAAATGKYVYTKVR